MQLIVETETTLDIDKTMSAVEDMQNNKVESLDITEKKCNGNKNLIEINTTAGEEESKLTSSSNNKLDKISNVDLSIIIHNQNSPEVKDAQTEESHDNNSENEATGLDTIESINEPTVLLEEEEEYEDDLISISEMPYNAISESKNQTGDHLRNNEETTNSKETLSNVELDKHPAVEVVDDKDDDDIEVIQSQDNEIQCEEEINKPSHEVQDDVELLGDSDCAIDSSDDLTEPTIQEDKDAVKVGQTLDDPVLLLEKAKEPLVQEKESEPMEIPIETEHLSENNVDTPMETCNADIVEEAMEVENETNKSIKNGTVQNEHNDDAMKKALQCENKIDSLPEESNAIPVQLQDENDSLKKGTDAVTIIEKDVMSVDDIEVSEIKDDVKRNEENILENEDLISDGEHTEEKVEDNDVQANNKDKLVHENDEAKGIADKAEDQLLNEKDEDNVLPENNADKLLDERDEIKVIQEEDEDQLLNEKDDDKSIQKNNEDKHLNEKDHVEVIQQKNEDQLFNEKDDDKVLQEKDEAKLLNEKDENKVLEEQDVNKVLDEKDKGMEEMNEKEVDEKVEDQLLEDKEELLEEKEEDKLTEEKKDDKLREEKEEDKPSKEDKLLEFKGEDELTKDNNAGTLKMDEDKDLALKDSSIDQNYDEATHISSESTDQSVNNGVVSSIKEVATNEIQSTDNVEILLSDDTNSSETMKCDALKTLNANLVGSPISSNDEKMDVEEVVGEPKAVALSELNNDMDVGEVPEKIAHIKEAVSELITTNKISPVKNTINEPFKLSNTLDILSDDDEESPTPVPTKMASPTPELSPNGSPKEFDETEKQYIDIEDDDDIMLVDEDANKETTVEIDTNNKEKISAQPGINTDSETGEKTVIETSDLPQPADEKDTPLMTETQETTVDISINEKTPDITIRPDKSLTPLVPDNFANIAKTRLADMTRDDLEEFCILKIVESVVDRSSLIDIKNKLKSMTQCLEEYKRKVMTLSKQHRDLQVVLKSVQEEQKKGKTDLPITPLKITRSVGMQVFMEKTPILRKKGQPNNNNRTPNTPQTRNNQGRQKQPNQQIPVPRLVPASPALKTPSTIPQVNQINMQNKNSNPPNGAHKNPSPSLKAEKRQFSKVAPSSITVDLTDDEPPAKMPGGPKTSPAPPVRLVPSQSLMAPQRQAFATNVNSPRKVYIPISGPQGQSIRPGQTIMLKTVPAPGIRARAPAPRPDQNAAVRINRTSVRHPAPLPLAMKQYQPPNWKALPPPPDLKLSKVENGIVISWKIDGIPEDSYEEIASYQLFAYQETSIPPNTTLWKKIGDVKALPLPMACTLTQFMAGFKYYFAVRAVDIRSRLGPFSLPGSILLLNKSM